MRKLSAHYIFDGSTFHKQSILILSDDNRVLSLEECPEPYKEQENVEFYNGILCPGFVNAHCHLELSYLKNKIPEGITLPRFVDRIGDSRVESEDVILKAMKQADIEMRENGIVAVGDISNNSLSFLLKQHSQIYYHTFIEMFDIFGKKQNVFNDGKQLYKENHRQIPLSLSPHAPYTCSQTLIARISEHAEEYEYPISIHNQECSSENDLYKKKTGIFYDLLKSWGGDVSYLRDYSKSSVQTYAPWLSTKQHVLFVHNCFTTREDILFLKKLRPLDTFTMVLCPQSNKYIAGEISEQNPPFTMFLNERVSVALGTDSLSSNHKLSILAEMQLLQDLHKDCSLEILLRCATLNGAKALGINSQYGSFAENKKPGVVLLENVDMLNMKLTQNTSVRVLV